MANITQRGKSYRLTVSCGYDKNGNQIRKTMTWTPEEGMTKRQVEKELHRQENLFEGMVKTGSFVDNRVFFSDFIDEWFKKYAEKQLKPMTISGYRAMVPRVKQSLGYLRIAKIQPIHLLDFYDEISQDGIRLDERFKLKIDLKAELRKRKMTQVQFANKAQISIHTVEAMIRGENVTHITAEKVSSALKISQNVLFERLSKGSLSRKTIKHYHNFISSVLSTAVQWQIIPFNPCDRIKAPKVGRSKPKYLDDEQAIRLFELLDSQDVQHKVMIQLLLLLGLRREELLGLKWYNVHFAQAYIYVEWSVQYDPKLGLYESDLKNTSSERTVKLPQLAIDALKEQKADQEKRKKLLGDRYKENEYVFSTDKGDPMRPDSLTSWFSKFAKKNGFGNITLHGLRHTNATLQIANHVPLTTVANRLGHADASTTTRVYAHAIRSADAAAAEMIDDIFMSNRLREREVR